MLPLATPDQMAAWPKPNYVNPESRKGMLYGFEIPLILITSAAMVLRMYTRAFITRSIGTDDWLMLVATIIGVALAIVNCMSCNFGLGLHIWDWSMQKIATDLAPFRKLALSTELLFVGSIFFSKSSILIFYLRIFSDKKFKILSYIGLGYTAIWALTTFCLGLFQCWPINSYWNYNVKGHCLPSLETILTTAVLNTVSDFYVFILPLRRVWNIQLPAKQRIGLMFVMAFGLLGCVAGIARIYYTKYLFHDTTDFTFWAVPVYISTSIECNFSIICSSLPAAKPLLARWFPKLLGGTSLHSHSASAHNFSRKGGAPGAGTAGHTANSNPNTTYSDKSKAKSSRTRKSGTIPLSSFAGDEVDSPTSYYNKNNYYHEMKGYSIGEYQAGTSSNSSEENIAPETPTRRLNKKASGDEEAGFAGIKRQVEIEVRYSEVDLGRPDGQPVDVPLPRRPSRTATMMLSRSPEEEELRRPRRI